MGAKLLPDLLRLPAFCVFSDLLQVRAAAGHTFLDLTARIEASVASSMIEYGLVNVQVRHTSAALVVNENEPLLLQDFERLFEQLAPREASYEHDRFDIRTVNVGPDERSNGHAHARTLLLRTSECVNLVDGCLQLGRWQRIFLVELDGERDREVSVLVMGLGQRPVEDGRSESSCAPD